MAFQDVTGKTIPKGRRGRLLSGRAAIGGALTLAAGLSLNLDRGETASVELFLILLLSAAALWAAAAVAFALTDETRGATSGGRSMLAELAAGLELVCDSRTYRRYLGARAGLLAAEVALPIYALYISSAAGSGASLLGTLAGGIALASGTLGPLASAAGVITAIIALIVFAVLGALAALTLPDAEKKN